MRKFWIAAVLALLPTVAQAATYTITWQQDSETTATSTGVERASATGNKCGVFVEVATVPFGTLSYVDSTAPTGFVCYRARNIAVIDPEDGTPAITKFSIYSNVDATKPGNPKGLQAQ